ncbi:MAG: hypothetical protein O2907_09140, partial [Proteobacteria bacterium]|nr:hypothetical protein [Pseudomonadota bacterium]MDA1064473.1 hypothetical protein [Pseudomonadota bacterium]
GYTWVTFRCKYGGLVGHFWMQICNEVLPCCAPFVVAESINELICQPVRVITSASAEDDYSPLLWTICHRVFSRNVAGQGRYYARISMVYEVINLALNLVTVLALAVIFGGCGLRTSAPAAKVATRAAGHTLQMYSTLPHDTVSP